MAISQRPGTTDEDAPSPWVGQRMTLEEFLALPEQKPALEYIDGIVRQKVAAKPTHASIQEFLSETLGPFVRRRRLGVLLPTARFVTPTWAPVPDIVFYRRERLRVRRAPPDFTEAPDLAIEISSPGQTLADQIQKCLDLLAKGTTVAFLIHPEEEAVFEFRQEQRLRVLRGDDRLELEDILPGFLITAREIFDAVDWSWLDEEPEDAAQADDDAAASERSDD
jgi:Uma2 family endonuclease